MTSTTQLCAALRYMEMATEPKKLAKAREAYRASHRADLIEVFNEAQRVLEKPALASD